MVWFPSPENRSAPYHLRHASPNQNTGRAIGKAFKAREIVSGISTRMAAVIKVSNGKLLVTYAALTLFSQHQPCRGVLSSSFACVLARKSIKTGNCTGCSPSSPLMVDDDRVNAWPSPLLAMRKARALGASADNLNGACHEPSCGSSSAQTSR